MSKQLSKHDMQTVKALIESAYMDGIVSKLVDMEWQAAVLVAGKALGATSQTAIELSADEVADRLSVAIDRQSMTSMKEHLHHIRSYFVVASEAGRSWSKSDVLIALLRLRECADADPLPHVSQIGGGK